MPNENVILVTSDDREYGTCEKLKAHQEGLLHRAFSIFIFNSENKMLLQQRALNKYHSGGLWTNACCSHPRPGEPVLKAAERRLFEEMGFRTPLQAAFSFLYHADVGQGLIEHEYDHVFLGKYDGPIDNTNPEEVHTYRWQDVSALVDDVKSTPELFTAWFLIALPKVLAHHLY
jgi:isopentenyl-diphosphate delta-isomerase